MSSWPDLTAAGCELSSFFLSLQHIMSDEINPSSSSITDDPTSESDSERCDWEPDPEEKDYTKDELLEALNEAMERTQSCPRIEQVLEKYLEHDPRSYRRIMRMLIDTNKQGKTFFFYSVRGYSVEEIRRLEKAGLNVRKDDVIFEAGIPSWVLQVEPAKSRIGKTEQKKIDEILMKYAESVKKRQEQENGKNNKRPVLMNTQTGTVVETTSAPPEALKEVKK